MNISLNESDSEYQPLDDSLIDQFSAIVGEENAIRDPQEMDPYLRELRNLFVGKASVVLRPGSTQEVSDIMKLAHKTGTAVVPQGGNTGLVGAQIPHTSGKEIILQLGRMNKVRSIDPLNNSLTVDSGMILQNIQQLADEHDRLFPLSLGAEGSCQIGGNLSSNAGGSAVLHYGNTRDLVLGLEVVMADGTIWDGLRKLRKNNTGYDLKHLFIGAEGTLGIITGVVLKLFPKPKSVIAAFIGLDSVDDALKLLDLARSKSGGVTSFEFLPRLCLDFALKHAEGTRDPLEASHPWYIILELSSGEPDESLRERMLDILGEALETELISDATVSETEAQRLAFWHIRHMLTEVQKPEGGSIKCDIAVPVSVVPEFLERSAKAVYAILPEIRIFSFGHLGDGNVHYNLSQPVGMDKEEYLGMWEEVTGAVHEITVDLGGTISAEHGIGRLKRDHMHEIKSAIELDMLRSIKTLFDPENILNPGKLL